MSAQTTSAQSDQRAPPYPWQEPVWDALRADMEAQRLPHALLLHGAEGLGKKDFAHCLAKALLCQAQVSAVPCGGCKSCLLFDSHNHPDLVVLEPSEAGKAIRIDQIRGIANFIGQTAQQGGHRCIIIQPADALNVNAANALLKSLEEPAANTTFLLVTASLQRLSPTIRSRCRFVAFPQPSHKQSLTWLKAHGLDQQKAEQLLTEYSTAPLRVLDAAEGDQLTLQRQMSKQLLALVENRESAVSVAKEWVGLEASFVIDSLLHWLNAGIKSQTPGTPEPGGSGFEASAVVRLIAETEPMAVFLLYDKVIAAKRLFLSQANPNLNLLWEDLLLDWLKYVQNHRVMRP